MIAAKVANALALDYPRELLQVIVASDGSTDATAERARAAGADLVLELPRGRQGRRPERRRRARERRAARLLRRQQRLGAGRPAHAWSSPSPTPRSATSAARSASSTPAGTTSRAPTGATRWRCGRWSRRWPGSPPATAPSTRSAATPTCRSPRPAATTSASPSRLAKRGLRSLYVPCGAGRGEDGADPRGRVRPQTADDGRALGHRRRRRDAVARAATRRSSPSSSPPTGCCATSARSCTCSPSLANLVLLGDGWVYTSPSASSWPCSPRPCSAAGCRWRRSASPATT